MGILTRRELITQGIQTLALAAVTKLNAQPTDIRTQLLSLVAEAENRCDILRNRLRACEEGGEDIAMPDSSLALGELFCRFSRSDAENKDLAEPALLSMRYILSMLDEEIKSVNRTLNHEAAYPKIPKWTTLGVTWRNGRFWSGNQPVFLCGLNWDATLANRNPSVFHRLGFTLADGMFRGNMNPNGSFDDAGWLAGDGAYMQRMSNTGIPVDCLLGDEPPEWMFGKYPSLRSPGYGNGDDYVLEDPMDIKYRHEFIDHFTPLYDKNRSFFAVDLANEPAFQGTSDILMELWRDWLRAKYGELEKLSNAWGVTIGDWKEIKDHPAALVPKSGIWWERGNVDFSQPGMRGKLYDWCAFNNERIGAYFKDLSDRLHAKDSHVATHVKVMMGSYFMGSVEPRGWTMNLSYHTYGIDQEYISKACSLLGGDLDLMDLSHVANPNRRFGSVPYICGWLDAGMSADFLKSLQPEKPFHNSEFHVTDDDTAPGDEEDAKAHIELALWLAHLHGMSAHLLWYWGRNADGSIAGQGAGWFKGSALQQPWMMHGYVRTNLNLRRFVRPVSSFAQLPRQVKLLYSEASAIQDVHYLDVLRDAYEALNFLGVPIGFLTEKQLAESGAHTDTRLIVAPNAQYSQDTTAPRLREAIGKGVTVCAIGKDCFKREPTGVLRQSHQLEGTEYLDISSPQRYHPQFERMMRGAGVVCEIRVLDERGEPAWGVEGRTTVDGGRRYAYLVNLMRETQTVFPTLPKGDKSFQDIITGKRYEDKIRLNPRQLILWEY